MDHRTILQAEHNHGLPCIPPSTITANVALSGQSISDLRCLNPVGFVKLQPPYSDIPYPVRSDLDPRIEVLNKPDDGCFGSQKRFLIFDQSGSHTRLFYIPSPPQQSQTVSYKIPTNGKFDVHVDRQSFVMPIVEENWVENHLNDEECGMLNDTEEIDALLYSGSEGTDYDDADNDDDNNEITSKEPSSFSIEDINVNTHKLSEVLGEEVVSSYGSPKRQKLVDGSYKKSSWLSGESPLKEDNLGDYEYESSYTGAGNTCDGFGLIKGEKRVKIREALKILETIIPKSEGGKDPLSVIDKAIIYLKSLKTEAEFLELSTVQIRTQIDS